MEKERKTVSHSKVDRCPECKSRNLIHDYDTGETICNDCGLVISEQMIARGPEWRAFTPEEEAQKSRIGIPETYSVHDKGLSTDVGGGPGGINYDAFGRKLPVATRLQMWRLRKWQIRSRVHTSVERNLAQAMFELDRLSDKLTIPPPVKEKAAIIYRKALEKKVIRGRSIVSMITATLFVACRLTGTARSIREVAEVSLIDKKELAHCYRLIIKELGIQIPVHNIVAYISKIGSRAGISGESQGLAIELLKQAKRKRVQSGKDPMGFAAAALYCACCLNNEKRTQRELAEIANVTEVTIRNRYKELKRRLNLTFPDEETNSREENFVKSENSLSFFSLASGITFCYYKTT